MKKNNFHISSSGAAVNSTKYVYLNIYLNNTCKKIMLTGEQIMS